MNVELQQQLIRDAFFTPSRVLVRHAADQALKLPGNWWSARPGIQTPEEPPARAMPTDHGLGAHDDQNVSPVAEP